MPSGGWASLVCTAEFAWPCEWAIATIQCESSGDPNVVAVENSGGVTYYFVGLFQVLNGPTDPHQNAVEANIQYVQWQEGKRGRPWPACP